VEVGINVEGVQKLQNQKTWRLEKTWRVGFFGKN
jgi:hypothetical protein